MANKSYPPEGYYSSEEAIRVLGLSNSVFHLYVKDGRILKYIPPESKRNGFYKKEYINQIASLRKNASTQDANDYKRSLRQWQTGSGKEEGEGR